MKNKIGFLILNYYAYEETINCIKSIEEKIDTNNYFIVVVENGSKNESYEILSKKYKDNKKIKILKSDENLGFANGNNIGFKYLKQEEKCDFIIMFNSDVLLISNNITKELVKTYKKENFAVLGPKIYTIENKIFEFDTNLSNAKEVKKDILTCHILIILCKFHLIKFFYKFKRNKIKESSKKYNKVMKDVIVHGCFIVFSKNYIDKFDGIDDRTFLYREEELLYIRCKNNNLLSMYDPKIKIRHLEDVSTNLSIPNFTKRKLNTYKCQLESSKILLEELERI